jgi:hypothetical protein
MSERIEGPVPQVTLPIAGSPRKPGACGAFSWGVAKEDT